METLGRYQLRSELGRGGFATVYRAFDPVLEREVAIKLLHPHLAADESIRTRFVHEGRALARVRHPNIVQVFDAGEVEGRAYLAMQLIDGVPVADLLREQGPLPLDQVRRIVSQVAPALDAVHRAGLVHRDIKPANIMLESETGHAILLDLGISRDIDTTFVTVTGQVLGTPGFLAPEQVAPSVPVGPPTDVYQLAATAYTMLTGVPPFEGDSYQIVYSVVHSTPAPPSEHRADLPQEVSDVVMQGLAKDPRQRPVSASAFATLLEAAANGAAPPPTAPLPTTAPAAVARPASAGSGSSRGGLWFGLVAAAVVLVLIAAGAFLFLGGGSSDDADDDDDDGSVAADGNSANSADIEVDGEEYDVSTDEPLDLTFDAGEGQRLALMVITTEGTANLSVRQGRFGEVMEPQYVSQGTVVLPFAVEGADRYTLRIEPGKDKTFEANIEIIKVADPIVLNADLKGTPLSFKGTTPAQEFVIIFNLTAGDRVSLDFGDVRDAMQGEVISPTGRVEAEGIYIAGGVFLPPTEVTETGEYRFVMRTRALRSPSVTVRTYRVPPDVSLNGNPGAPVQLAVTVPGQKVSVTFTAPPEGRALLRFRGVSTAAQFTLSGPAEEVIAADVYVSPGESFLGPYAVTAGGVHRIVFGVNNAQTPRGELTVISVPQDARGTIAVGGETVPVALVLGQSAVLTFTATANQKLEVHIGGASLSGDLLLFGPDGNELSRLYVGQGDSVHDLENISRAGQYTLVLVGDNQPFRASVALRPAQ